MTVKLLKNLKKIYSHNFPMDLVDYKQINIFQKMLFLYAIDVPCSFKIFWEAQACCILSTEWFSWAWHECLLITMCHFYCDVIKVGNLLPLSLRSERLKQAAGITCKRKVHSCTNHTVMSFVCSKGYILDLKGKAHLTDTHLNEVHAFYFRST